ncbi:hypothetical protein A4X13_0g8406 [Tilletia indica]|uniref:Integrase catalytic domain-containing protein n=1 Tax=Tilletia indica TaxID=43049 RepID=A0A8T8SEY2_9BASI|nr:hypothetical protein A4X13_0g8406 [Tilletia indica]
MSLLNAVTIRDANVPPNLTDFCEELSGRVCYGSGDGHSFFDQIILHPDSRPMTAIRTIHGTYQSTRLPQGATNSPAYAQRVSTHIFLEMLGELVQVFVDDLVIKGPRSDYDNKMLEGTNLRLWFLEYLRTYAIVLRRYQHAGLTLSGEKFIAITPKISITGIVVDKDGKHSDPTKVAKLENWPCPPPNVSSLRGFLGLANYLRPFIKDFATIDAPLRKLMTGRFRWNDEATLAMEELKQAAKEQPILVAIDYSSTEALVLAVDSSQIAAGWALYQGDAEAGELRKLNQYGSVGFSDVESRYSQPQLELCGVFKAVKHLRHHLYGVFFILEVDAASLRQMINSPDIPNAAMTRWVQYLKLFDQEIRHVPAKRHTLPDGLSRTDFDTVEAAEEWPVDKIGLDAVAVAEGGAQEEGKGTEEENEEAKQGQADSDRPRERGEKREEEDDKDGASQERSVIRKEMEFAVKDAHNTGGDPQRRTAEANKTEASAGHIQAYSFTNRTPSTLGPSTADISDWRRRATEGSDREYDLDSELQGQPAVSQEEGTRTAPTTDDLQRQTVGTSVQGSRTSHPARNDPRPAGTDTPEGAESSDADDILTTRFTTTDSSSSRSSNSDIEQEDAIPLRTHLYSDKWLNLAEYLHSGLSPTVLAPLNPARRKWVKRQLGKFFVRSGRLYKRGKHDVPLLVIDSDELKERLLHEAHERHGHRGRDATISLLAKRVWWERLAHDCVQHVISCDPCQRRQQRVQREPARYAAIPNLFSRFNMDIVDLGQGVGPKRYLVVARDALSGWPEARLLSDKSASSVRTFLEEDILTRYGGAIQTILTDNGTENAGEAEWIIKHLGFNHAYSTEYNPEGNSEVERGHGPLVEGMLKASYDDRSNTASYLPYALWADRITTRRTTLCSPFELVYGMDPIIPMDLELETFVLFDWDTVQSTTHLIAARIRQLKRRMDDLHLAKLRLELSRSRGRSYADSRHAHLLRDPLPPNTLVIVSNPKHDQRAQDRWMGPYRVTGQLPGGSYSLAELDGTRLQRNYAAKHVRRYFTRPVPVADASTVPQHLAPAPQTRRADLSSSTPVVPSSRPPLRTSSQQTPATAPPVLRLPVARMSRPALPHRDIPPSVTIRPHFTPYVLDNGITFPSTPPTVRVPGFSVVPPRPHQRFLPPPYPPPEFVPGYSHTPF